LSLLENWKILLAAFSYCREFSFFSLALDLLKARKQSLNGKGEK